MLSVIHPWLCCFVFSPAMRIDLGLLGSKVCQSRVGPIIGVVATGVADIFPRGGICAGEKSVFTVFC